MEPEDLYTVLKTSCIQCTSSGRWVRAWLNEWFSEWVRDWMSESASESAIEWMSQRVSEIEGVGQRVSAWLNESANERDWMSEWGTSLAMPSVAKIMKRPWPNVCLESFRGMELTGENRSRRSKARLPLCTPYIPHGLAWDRTPASSVARRRQQWKGVRSTYALFGIAASIPGRLHGMRVYLVYPKGYTRLDRWRGLFMENLCELSNLYFNFHE
jgi:hypothetical protein